MPPTPTAGALAAIDPWVARHGVALNPAQHAQLARYLDTLLLWNRRVALISQRDPRPIVSKHVADSLAAAAVCQATERVADLGSGAGFPGLVIAIAHPAAHVTLIESQQKKVSFLLEALRAAGVRNARVAAARIEAVAARPDQRAQYTLVTARALAGVGELLALARPLLAARGRALLMKGPRQESTLAAGDARPLGFALEHTLRYALPDGAARLLLVFRLLSDPRRFT
jgi:16S rRNA (guanine527-N7)-methyltransferase